MTIVSIIYLFPYGENMTSENYLYVYMHTNIKFFTFRSREKVDRYRSWINSIAKTS